MADLTKIFVNGKEVDPNSLDNLPDAVRQIMVDADKNGVPDVLENIWQNPMVQKLIQRAGEKAGTVYTNFDQLPSEMREPIQKLMTKLGSGGGATVAAASSPSVFSQAPTQNWQALEQAEAPKTLSIKVIFLVMAVIVALLLAGWIFLVALRSP